MLVRSDLLGLALKKVLHPRDDMIDGTFSSSGTTA